MEVRSQVSRGVFLLSLAAGTAALGSACGPAVKPPLTESIEALFADYAAPGMPGASVLVVRNDSVLISASWGLADVDSMTPVTPATNFRLASLSKQFTAMAVLQLVAAGTLRLEDPAATLLPELPAFAGNVTIRHLLTHTSGLDDYEDFVPDDQQRQVSDAEVLQLIAGRSTKPGFGPGTRWHYSNTGYALLALIVERASGMRYADYLAERIFAPVGMTGTVAFEAGRSAVPRRAYGHQVDGSTVRRTDQSNTSAVLGDGGIYSSIEDLARWDAALSAGSLIPAALWREATTPYRLTGGDATEYGFGWFVDTFRGATRLRHHGETRGFTNAIARFPDRRLTVIILTNRTGGDPWDIADAIAASYLD